MTTAIEYGLPLGLDILIVVGVSIIGRLVLKRFPTKRKTVLVGYHIVLIAIVLALDLIYCEYPQPIIKSLTQMLTISIIGSVCGLLWRI